VPPPSDSPADREARGQIVPRVRGVLSRNRRYAERRKRLQRIVPSDSHPIRILPVIIGQPAYFQSLTLKQPEKPEVAGNQ
jgi:hypothetical protein